MLIAIAACACTRIEAVHRSCPVVICIDTVVDTSNQPGN